MPRKSVKKEKTSKRGKGDVKQSVKVSVRIGDVKPKRKRQYKRKPKGEGGLARPEETRTLYGNIPPPPPQQFVYTPQIPPAFQKQPTQANLLEDVKKERQNLLEDIKREISGQIVKAQGAEQRGELAKAGAFDPFKESEYARPKRNIEESIKTTAPTFAEIKQSKPIIEEISSTQFKEIPLKKGQKKMVLEQGEQEEAEGFKYRIPLGRPREIPESIGGFKVQEPMSVERPPSPLKSIVGQAVQAIQTKMNKEPKKEPKKQKRTIEKEMMGMEDVNAPENLPSLERKGMMKQDVNVGMKLYTQKALKEMATNPNLKEGETLEAYKKDKSIGAYKVIKEQNEEGDVITKLRPVKKSKIPVRDIEAQPIPTATAQAYNLLPVVEAQPFSSFSGEAVKMV